jgi:Flp pilus assembly protein TadD/peroxiredoxin
LIHPLKAPDFSLPDMTGTARSIASLRGGFVLLHFWATTPPTCRSQLKLLQQQRAQFTTRQLTVLSLNLDDPVNDPETISRVRTLVEQEQITYPVLLATPEVAGVYNIVHRYLYDRRRDLPIPASFLIDSEGMIVAVYQGELNMERLLEDVQSIPATSAARVQRALPFPGTLYQGRFQRNDFTFGVAMFQHGYLEQAAASFRQVITANPEDAEGYYNLGTLNLRRNDFAQARKYLEQALKLKPDYPEAWNNLGMIAAQQGHPDQAVESFQQSLRLRPAYATALLNLGNVYRRNGQIAMAQETLSRALALEPGDPEANYSMGMFYAQQSQLQPASEYLNQAIALRPDYPEALNNLGVLFVRQHRYTEAESRFRTCIGVAPQFDQSYLNLARLYAVQHEKEKAKQTLEDLLRLQPDNAGAKQGLVMLDSMP